MRTRKLESTPGAEGAAASPRRRKTASLLAGILTFGLIAGSSFGGAGAALAGVGGGGLGGDGSGGAGAADYALVSLDSGSNSPVQGTGQASINYFAAQFESAGGWADGVGGDRSGINTACTTAINQAISRTSGATTARVVMVGAGIGYVGGVPYFGWAGNQADMRSWFQDETDADAWQSTFPTALPATLSQVHDVFQANVPANPQIVCVALNNLENAPGYDLALSTAKNAVPTVAGTTAAVSDRLIPAVAGPIHEDLTGTIGLHWGGVEGNDTSDGKSVTFPNVGTSSTPSFTPSDFGWASWPPGHYWFNVKVPKQGSMNAAVDLDGSGDAAESWTVAPVAPVKTLTSSAGGALADSSVLAAGMFYNAQITASPNGYASSMTITDVVHTDQVFIGGQNADNSAAVQLLNPDGVAVGGANIAISRTPGQVAVSATVTGIPAKFQALNYTLVVPSYVQPTTVDYTITDDSKVCYTAAQTGCITGNSKTTRKVTPAPNKVWVLDAAGALTAADPAQTNQAGVDQKVFAPGSNIGAVINGSIPAGLEDNLSQYSITDDWTGASSYIDFSDASKARVFLNGADVTSQFQITVSGTKTTAAATAAFLSATKGLASAAAVKLYIGGTFRLDYDSPDTPVALSNAGSEQWNSEAINTNTPAIYTVTPDPDKAWVLDQDGGLTTVDSGKSNTVGSDGKVFLPGDAVSAVINGSIPANLGSALTSYALTDDWTGAAQYVDFNDATLAHVYLNGVDVTSSFSVNVVGTTTVATATPAFLAGTVGLAAAASVKLIVSGAFRDDYDTNGSIVTLTNAGSESWNGKTVATNSPPVYTWTPDPNKQVLGSADESGDKAEDNINGATVYPGQKLEYSVGVDLRVPAGTARGVKSLALEDDYDTYFIPDKTSVEFWDTRDPTNPKPVPRAAYVVTFDDAAHQFTATFTQAWISANVADSGADSEWLSQGWLTMRFTGTVSPAVPAGSTVSNQAFQILNGAKTGTDIPTVNIPTIAPGKESLSTSDTSIDGKTVFVGNVIVYRLTLDGGPGRNALAYNVHKLGIVDDYDDAHLTLDASAITVTDKATGADVTGSFNVQVTDGVAYVFAKTVDTPGAYGGTIPGDPQPADLAAYDKATIAPLADPIIDQSLLGRQFYVTLRATVSHAEDGATITNQATENIENSYSQTPIVSNPLADIDPSKDVVVDEASSGTSLDGSEIRLNTAFTYRLNSSAIPANRAYGATSWSLSDKFDKAHDQYTGLWAIYANADVYDGTSLLFKKGDLLEDSQGDEQAPWTGLFDVAFDEASYTFTAAATQKYLDLIEERPDLAAAFSVYVKMLRVAPGDKIVNTATESYDGSSRDTNQVSTITKEYPGIAVEKYTLAEGPEAGVHADQASAYQETPQELATHVVSPENAYADGADAGQTVQNGVNVGIHVDNTGDVALKALSLVDTTQDGLHGELQNIQCAVPFDPSGPGIIIGGQQQVPDANGMIWAQAGSITELKLAQGVDCRGILRDMEPGMMHGDTVVATAQSVFTDAPVSAQAQWFAAAPASPAIRIEEYTLSEGTRKGDRNTLLDALKLDAGQAKYGTQVGFIITNTGNEPLAALAFKNVAMGKASTGQVGDVRFLDPLAKGQKAPSTATTVKLGRVSYVEKPVSAMKSLEVGQKVLLVGMLTGVKPGTHHTDLAHVSAIGIYDKGPAKDQDPWNARSPKLPPAPAPPRAGAVTGVPIAQREDSSDLLGSAGMLLLAAALVAVGLIRRQRRRRPREA